MLATSSPSAASHLPQRLAATQLVDAKSVVFMLRLALHLRVEPNQAIPALLYRRKDVGGSNGKEASLAVAGAPNLVIRVLPAPQPDTAQQQEPQQGRLPQRQSRRLERRRHPANPQQHS